MATDWPDALRWLTEYTWSNRPSPPPSRPTSCTQCASLPQPASLSMKVTLYGFPGTKKWNLSHLAITVRLAGLDHLIPRAEQLKAMLLASICYIPYLQRRERCDIHFLSACLVGIKMRSPRCSPGVLCPWVPCPWWIQNSRGSCRWEWTIDVSSSYT